MSIKNTTRDGKTGNVGNAGKAVAYGCQCSVGTFLRSLLNPASLRWNVNSITLTKKKKGGGGNKKQQQLSLISLDWNPSLDVGSHLDPRTEPRHCLSSPYMDKTQSFVLDL